MSGIPHLPLEDQLDHVVGNAVFALETNMISLRRRTNEEGRKILDEMQISIERIKEYIHNHS